MLVAAGPSYLLAIYVGPDANGVPQWLVQGEIYNYGVPTHINKTITGHSISENQTFRTGSTSSIVVITRADGASFHNGVFYWTSFGDYSVQCELGAL
jgi:hypothetical protein